MKGIKKAMAIHDLSGRGHCSLGAVLPILTIMGIEVCPLPTAILSSQTDGYEGYSFLDLTTTWEDYLAHWQKEQMEFDCIYSGFLGSLTQIDQVRKIIKVLGKEHTMVLVDPVLGDNGKLYDTMNQAMVAGMQQLAKEAKVITPNYTELLLLLGKEYKCYTKEETMDFIAELAELGPDVIIVTSVPMGKEIYTFVYEKESGQTEIIRNDYLNAHYPGSGDIFASVVCAMLLKGYSAVQSARAAADFIREGIQISLEAQQPYRDGIVLEKIIQKLIQY